MIDKHVSTPTSSFFGTMMLQENFCQPFTKFIEHISYIPNNSVEFRDQSLWYLHTECPRIYQYLFPVDLPNLQMCFINVAEVLYKFDTLYK